MFKKYFPYFQNSETVYLDNAATTQKPKVVIDEIVDYYSNYCSNTHRSNHGNANKATKNFEHTRTILREFINAKENKEIIFTKGVTESINFIVNSYVKKRFSTIIISSLEHHSNIVPWHILGKSLNRGLEVINCNNNLDFDMNNFEEILKNNPNSFVSITHISNAFGKIHDIKAIIDLAHKYGAKVMIDGAQSLTHTQIDVQDLDVDFFAISSHKSFGPTGVGAIYVKAELLDELLPYQTGGATINDVSFQKTVLLDSPYKFEAGTQNIADVIAFGKALEFIQNIGYENILKEEKRIYLYLYEELSKIEDIIFYSDIKNSIGSLSFNIKNIMAEDIGILLDKMGIALRCGHHCAQGIMKELNIEGTIRVSIAFYNTKEDINILITSLKKAISMLKDE